MLNHSRRLTLVHLWIKLHPGRWHLLFHKMWGLELGPRQMLSRIQHGLRLMMFRILIQPMLPFPRRLDSLAVRRVSPRSALIRTLRSSVKPPLSCRLDRHRQVTLYSESGCRTGLSSRGTSCVLRRRFRCHRHSKELLAWTDLRLLHLFQITKCESRLCRRLRPSTNPWSEMLLICVLSCVLFGTVSACAALNEV